MRMQQRRKTATNWTTLNEVLLDGEIGVESNTGKLKVGDGVTAWNSLAYSGGSTVTSNSTVAGYVTAAGETKTALDAAYDAKGAAAALVGAAPTTLDTLNELAAALGNDANFATTVTNSLATKAPTASPTFTGTVSGISKSMVGLANVDNTADASKPVSTAQAAADAAVQAASLQKTANLSDLNNASTARTNLGLGTAATSASTAFDAAGAATSAQAYAIQRGNHTGTQAASTITGLATVATSGAYTDLTSRPATAVYNVKDYGATGNGSTDDTTAVQSAVTAAVTATGRVFFPAGTYLCGSLTVTGDVAIYGAGWGTTVKLKNSTNAYLFIIEKPTSGSVSVDFADLLLHGNATNQTAGGIIHGRNIVQSRFDNIHFQGAYDRCLWIRNRADGSGYGHHNRVTRCLFDGLNTIASANQQGIVFQSSDENYVAFCDFENWGGTAASPGSEPYAIKDWSGLQQIISNVFVGGQESIRIQDASSTRVIGNTFDGNGRSGVHASGSKNVISGNLFSDGSGATSASGSWAQCEIDNSSSANISGNIFTVQSTTTVRNCVREYSASSNRTLVANNTFDISGSLYGGNKQVELYGANSRWVNSTGATQDETSKNNFTATTDPTVSSDSTGGYSTGSQWVNTSTSIAYQCLSAATGAAVWRRLHADVQVFTASGTWTRPAWVSVVQVECIGAGGGGGSGARLASATASSGGAGGGGGGRTWAEFPASVLSATETVTVGTGGGGAAAISVNTTVGATGTTGGNSTFGTAKVRAQGGAGGGGGQSAAVSTAGTGGTGEYAGIAGGAGASGAVGGASSNANYSPTGGGAGGGVTAAPAFTAGGAAGFINAVVTNGNGTGGATAGAAGVAPTNPTLTGVAIPGFGGGGGASSATAAGGAGANASLYGGGGGGGGSSINGFNSGAGGNGANGIVVVISN